MSEICHKYTVNIPLIYHKCTKNRSEIYTIRLFANEIFSFSIDCVNRLCLFYHSELWSVRALFVIGVQSIAHDSRPTLRHVLSTHCLVRRAQRGQIRLRTGDG